MKSSQVIKDNDSVFMNRCLELAKKGLGDTYPNPLVGCVIVYKNIIIAEGWHKKSGEKHAESEAIEMIKDKSVLKDSILYVNLEPCSHHGKTSPCVDLILKMKIKKVVIGTKDPNKKVNGSGIKKLIQSNCNVTVGVNEKKCLELNKRFFTFHNKKRPYIILKWAESKDGFIAPKDKKQFWLTNSYSKQIVHKLRSEEDSILIGVQTAINDNPKLTTRFWFGKNPKRIIIDPNNRMPKESNLHNDHAKTYILKKKSQSSLLNNENLNFKNSINEILSFLHNENIQSVIIEGGAKTISFFLNLKVWDEALIFKTNKEIKVGIKAPVIKIEKLNKTIIQQDTLLRFLNV